MHKDNTGGNDKVEMISDDQSMNSSARNSTARNSTIIFEQNTRPRWFWFVVIASIILLIAGLVCIVIAATLSSCSKTESSAASVTEACRYSPEAKRVGLEGFLREAQLKYFEMNPESVAWQPDIDDIDEHVRTQ